MTRRKCHGDVVTAGVGMDIHHFAAEVEPSATLGSHGFGHDFLDGNASTGHRGLFQGQGAGDGHGKALQVGNQREQRGVGELRHLQRAVHSAFLEYDIGQTTWDEFAQYGSDLLASVF